MLKIILLFLICTATSFFVRTCAYNREAAVEALQIRDANPLWHGTYNASGFPAAAAFSDMLPGPRPNFMPYTVESAMMFAYASDVASGRGVPERDSRLAGMENLPPWAQMNMTLEWVLGFGYRLLSLVRTPPEPPGNLLKFEDMPDFAWFVSVNVRLWMSLLSGLVFLWLIVLRVPPKLAFAGGMLHACAAAAVARATGQDIVRGDFCIPLIVLSMVLAHSLYLRYGRLRLIALFLTVFTAFAAWDLCQMLFGFWALFEIVRVLCGGGVTYRRRAVWIAISAAVVLNAAVVPFHVTYGLMMSKLVCVALPLLMLTQFVRIRNPWKRLAVFLAAGAALQIFYAVAVDNPEYRANYSHFSNVMRAKILNANVKPSNPALLDYDSRIMWTPSMHSCTWEIAAGFFPSLGSLPGCSMKNGLTSLKNLWNFAPLTGSCFAFLFLAGCLFTRTRRAVMRGFPASLMPYLFTLGFIFGFAYVVRYHEFLILFLSLSFPLLARDLRHGLGEKRRVARGLLTGLLWFFVVFELFVTVCARSRAYGTVDAYLGETAALVKWLRADDSVRGRTVIADFTLGPQLMAYAGANIAMQPQFGMEPIRRPVEEYLRILYHGTERELLVFCEKYHADYLVYDKGATGPMHPFSMRYIANAAEIEPSCPANLMMRLPDSMRRFVPVPAPGGYSRAEVKYTVFKVVKDSDLLKGSEFAEKASDAVRRDDLTEAKVLVKKGLAFDPASDRLRRLYSLLFGRSPIPSLSGGR